MQKLLCVLCLAMTAAPAVAQDKQPKAAGGAPEQDARAAAELRQQGDDAAAEERWREAADHYRSSFALSGDPELNYDIGRALARANDCEFGLIYLERYLSDSSPESARRADAEMAIASCRQDLAAPVPSASDTTNQAPSAPEPESAGTQPEIPTSPAAPPGDGLRKGAWIAVGISAALATAGTIFAVSAEAREDDVRGILEYRDSTGAGHPYSGDARELYLDKLDEGKRLERMAWIGFGAAGAAAAAAAVLFVLSDADGAPAVSPAVSEERAMISASWSFR